MNLSYELHDLVRTLDRWADRALRTEDLNYNRYVALVVITEHPGIAGRQLAGALGVSEPAVSGIVRKLIDAGLVTNSAEAGSGNVRRLTATSAGTDKYVRCGELLGDALDRSAERIGLDPAELAHTIRNLHDAVRAD